MQWSEMSSILIMLFLLGACLHFMRQNSVLKRENRKLLKETGKYNEMTSEAKEILKSSTEVETVKSLRIKYGLSLIDAKEIVDAVK